IHGDKPGSNLAVSVSSIEVIESSGSLATGTQVTLVLESHVTGPAASISTDTATASAPVESDLGRQDKLPDDTKRVRVIQTITVDTQPNLSDPFKGSDQTDHSTIDTKRVPEIQLVTADPGPTQTV